MSQTYKYIALDGNAFVFANVGMLSDTVRRTQTHFKSKATDVVIYRDVFARNTPYTIVNDCVPCGSTDLTLAVKIELSGPLTAKAEKLRLARELLELIVQADTAGELDGFPMTMNTVYTAGQE